MDTRKKITAGDFKTWLTKIGKAIADNKATEVPCGSCTACCTSSYFIHIRPEETKTLNRIPKELLFPAPGLPKGHKVMGFDNRGHCPMLKDNTCTIYKDRPMTCRSYDCRVFCATGLPAGDDIKVLVNRQIERWRFSFSNDEDRKLYQAVRKTTKFLVKHKQQFPKDFIPSNTTQLAILAIKVYPLFVSNAKDESQLIQRIIHSVND